jgi:GNAT superfamily N-acetyltransferase
MAEGPAIELWDAAACLDRAQALADFFAALWPDDDWTGFAGKLEGRAGLCALVARDGEGRVAGCKLAYAKHRTLLYSWLGGVRADRRGQGLAARLMSAQHAHARAAGYAGVETSTRQGNAAMAIANLKAGFVITGFEAVPGEVPKVHFLKRFA